MVRVCNHARLEGSGFSAAVNVMIGKTTACTM